eukprot:TRINITY_DN4102_c0_g1_i3.p1 TRINITY_DN4102_c0_g1~~TRINITY_DN4102_c0_g1_i3.p1  ORF type:complete len:234 (+),score=65.12 TRINITY_DN4102_c0_g1_i3:237-938(+)
MLDRVLAASAKLPTELQLSQAEVATLNGLLSSEAAGMEMAAQILCKTHERWPVANLATLLWLLRWVVTKEAGNQVVANYPGMLGLAITRMGELPATARMMGLAMLANLSAHEPGKAALSSGVAQEAVEMCLLSMEAPQVLERRTAAALLYNLALCSVFQDSELVSVQMVCGLFPLVNTEQDEETKIRLLAALIHTLFCNSHACEAAANFGFELDKMEGKPEEMAQEIRSLYSA